MTHDNLSLAERRATQLYAAAQVAHHITSIMRLDETLARTVDVICDEFGFYYAGIFMLDESGQWAVLRAGRGQAGARLLTQGHKLAVGGQSMIGTAIAQGQARIALDVGQDPVRFDNPLLPLTRSEMALPLRVGQTVIGALTVQSTQAAAFTHDDIMSLQTVADQLAIAIQNARMHEQNQTLLAQIERRARLLSAAAQVGQGVTALLDMDELLRKTVDIICEAYQFYFSCVYLLDESREWLVLSAAHGEAGEKMLAAGHRLPVGGKSMNGTVAITGRARITLNVDQDPVHMKNPLLPQTRSEMVLPLLINGVVIGTLAVQSIQENAFNDDDITTLQTMADQLAIAINNARLLRDLKAAHQELVRTKTFEALATSTIEAIHWIGNKALPISTSVRRLIQDVDDLDIPAEARDSMQEDLSLIEHGVRMIISVQEHLIGPAREHKPQPTMLDDLVYHAAVEMDIPDDEITYHIAPRLPLILADPTQVSRALRYVLQNALEAQTAERHITVKVMPTPDEQSVVVRIADRGPGIPADQLDKIWATFYTTKGGDHAGLGLAATLQIVRQLGGQVSAGNAPEGGAQIELCIPAFQDALPPPVRGRAQAILLVDDTDSWSQWARSVWGDLGHTVMVSDQIPANPERFDWIVIDQVLNHQDALKQFKQAERLASKTVVVASNLRVEKAMQWMQFGVRDVIIKPYTPAGLAAMVQAIER